MTDKTGASKSKSVLTLLLWNLVILVWALVEKWNPFLLIIIYWLQSLLDMIFIFIVFLRADRVYMERKGVFELMSPAEKLSLYFPNVLMFVVAVGWALIFLTDKKMSRFFDFSQCYLTLVVSSCLYIAHHIFSLVDKGKITVIADKLSKFLVIRVISLWFILVILTMFAKIGRSCVLVPFMFVKIIVDIAGELTVNKAFLRK